VPDKIQRKFAIARDLNEQIKSCERLKNKKPFVVAPVSHQDSDKKGKSPLRNSMAKIS